MDRTFDAGVCIEVIEHLTPTTLRSLVAQLAAVSRPGSLYLFNSGQPDFVEREDPGYLDPHGRGHIVSYSLAGAASIFAPAGFNVIELPGRAWAFLAEFGPQRPGRCRGADLRGFGIPCRRMYPCCDRHGSANCIRAAGIDAARAYLLGEVTMTVHDHSRWGPTDQIGAGNLLTVEKRLAALQSVRDGRVYDVSHEISIGAPFMAPNQTPFLLSIWASWRDSIKRRRALGATNDAGANVERIEMTAHVGTHIDALGHFSKGDRLYNGLSAADTVTDWGLERLGIEHAPPMITRGVLLDVAGCDGGQHLNPGRVVTPDELARAEEAAKVTLEPGDIALIRTGWGRYFGIDNARYLQGEPGIDLPGARWLIERGVVAIGCDNMAVEVLPNPNHGISMPVHQHALAEAGVYLIENLALDELARDGVGSFCFILLATKFRGATGSPVRPVAMV